MSRRRRRRRKSPWAAYNRRLTPLTFGCREQRLRRERRTAPIGPSAIEAIACCLGRRRLARRHDLVGGAPDEFGHVIELERKAADARGRRAHLDDQIADL